MQIFIKKPMLDPAIIALIVSTSLSFIMHYFHFKARSKCEDGKSSCVCSTDDPKEEPKSDKPPLELKELADPLGSGVVDASRPLNQISN